MTDKIWGKEDLLLLRSAMDRIGDRFTQCVEEMELKGIHEIELALGSFVYKLDQINSIIYGAFRRSYHEGLYTAMHGPKERDSRRLEVNRNIEEETERILGILTKEPIVEDLKLKNRILAAEKAENKKLGIKPE